MGFVEGAKKFARAFLPPSIVEMEREQEENGMRNVPRKFIMNTLFDNDGCLPRGELKDLYSQRSFSRLGVHLDPIIDEGIREGFLITQKKVTGVEICIADFSPKPQEITL